MPDPRILHVVRQFAPCIGGLEDAVYNLAQHQRRHQGIDARVLTLDRAFTAPDRTLAKTDLIGGVPVRRIAWAGSSRYPLAPGVFRHLAQSDVIHVHAVDFFFDALAAAAPFHARPMIATTHGGFFHTDRQSTLKRLYFNTVTRLSSRAYAAIVACGAGDAAMFAPIAGDRLHLIENGIAVDRFRDLAPERATRRLITIGRFASHKRIAALFPILAALRTGGDWRLTVAGAQADQPLASLRQEAAAAGVADAVDFLCAPDEAELARAIAASSYFVSASAYEGFGIAALEAMTAGLYPVLSDIPPFRTLLARAGIGALFDPDRPGSAVTHLLEMDAKGGMAYRARQRLVASACQYGWPTPAAAYAKLYDQALQPRRHGATHPAPAH